MNKQAKRKRLKEKRMNHEAEKHRTERIKRFMNEMHAQGVFTSPYNHDRYIAVRDYLTSVGMIDAKGHVMPEAKAQVFGILNGPA